MNNKVRLVIFIITSGLFLFLDQFLKFLARTNPDFTFYFGTKWLGWEHLANKGIAFSLPFPNFILIIFTPLIVLVLFIFLIKQKRNILVSFGILLIIAGAFSNLIDRILFEATVDYFRILTSVINLADVIIVIGAGLIFLEQWKKKKA